MAKSSPYSHRNLYIILFTNIKGHLGSPVFPSFFHTSSTLLLPQVKTYQNKTPNLPYSYLHKSKLTETKPQNQQEPSRNPILLPYHNNNVLLLHIYMLSMWLHRRVSTDKQMWFSSSVGCVCRILLHGVLRTMSGMSVSII